MFFDGKIGNMGFSVVFGCYTKSVQLLVALRNVRKQHLPDLRLSHMTYTENEKIKIIKIKNKNKIGSSPFGHAGFSLL